MSETTVVIWAAQFCLWALVLILLFRLGTLVGKQSAQLEQMHHNWYHIERRIVANLEALQSAVADNTKAVDAALAALPSPADQKAIDDAAATVAADAKRLSDAAAAATA